MEISSCDFMELTLGELSDVLLKKLCENKANGTKNYSQALLTGKDEEGNLYKLSVVLTEAIE